MTPFAPDSQPVGTSVSSVAAPTGTLGFSPSLLHCLTPTPGGCWQTWSNGYSGDVYASSGTVTLTLPSATQAFYFYAEPDQFMTFSMTASSNDGTTSGPIQVAGEAGAQYFGFYTTGSTTLTTITVSGSDPDGFAVGEFGMSGCDAVTGPTMGSKPDYCIPADWDASTAPSAPAPGMEPLNVIISAQSTVSLAQILSGLENFSINPFKDWDVVPPGLPPAGCISVETADVTGNGPVPQAQAWRLGGCTLGNALSGLGDENHVRLWNQPVAGSTAGAWFVTASFERLCVLSFLPYHCITSNGYNNGAAGFVDDIVRAGPGNKWSVSVRVDQRRAGANGNGAHSGAGVGVNNVSYNGTVEVVTVD
jgi:hypothetical protein